MLLEKVDWYKTKRIQTKQKILKVWLLNNVSSASLYNKYVHCTYYICELEPIVTMNIINDEHEQMNDLVIGLNYLICLNQNCTKSIITVGHSFQTNVTKHNNNNYYFLHHD